MGDPALKQPPLTPADDLELSPPLDPPLSDEEKAWLLEALDKSETSEAFKASVRRDLEQA